MPTPRRRPWWGDGRLQLGLPFRRQLGLAYVATLGLLVGVEALWYHSVTHLVATVQWVDDFGGVPAATPAPGGAGVTGVDRGTAHVGLNTLRAQANVAIARTVVVTAVAFVLAFAITGLAVLRTEREMDRRQEAERKAVEARDAAERMSRAKSDFLAHVSHELRTPLNSVIGFSNVLLRDSLGAAGAQDLLYLERIRDNGRHLLSLIDDLLDLSKIEAGKVQVERSPVLLDRLIAETIGQLEGRLQEKTVVLRTDLPLLIAPLSTDERKLKQVLINLVGNAIKFTDLGTITIRVVADPETAEAIRIDVADTGIGIPATRLGAIFEAFEQADQSTARRHEGTGLGLSIARSFCELMGYGLSVESEEGIGATFSVHLAPTRAVRHWPPAEATAASRAPSQPAAAGSSSPASVAT